MKISRAASYAITAAAQLSHDPAKPPVPCSQLAKAGAMPERFLLQIMRNLVADEICVSTRGVDGGYRLARPASKITLLELVEAVDGPIGEEIEAIEGLAPASNRLVRETLKASTTYYRTALNGVHLSSMQAERAKPLAATA